MEDAVYTPHNGLVQDTPDTRDFAYSTAFGADVTDVDWQTGFDAFKDVGLEPITEDQGSSDSCVSQGTAPHLRIWNKKLTGQDVDFSRKFIYSQISLGLHAGASLRDGVKLVSSMGDCRESTLPSYQNGNPPTEEYMFSQAEITDAMRKEALPFDRFTYRVIPGYTADINLFAHAIKNNCGVVAGFTGTNPGWCRPVIRAPQQGESKWGHCVFLSGFGMYEGKKCVFTKNSWGDRYSIPDGPWKGFQAIPEDYFLAATDTAVGPVSGAYVFNAWVLVPDSQLTPNQRVMDFLQKHEGKLVQDSTQTGAFGLVKNGQILVASSDRVPELIATYLVQKDGTGVPADLWNSAPKANF